MEKTKSVKFLNRIVYGNNLELLVDIPDKSINLVITSPPYYKQRDYGEGIGNERIVEDYIENLCKVFHERVRVVKDNGE